MYVDTDKYDGINDSFDFKLGIFIDICNRAGLPLDSYMLAFPSMLKGLAQVHYYNRGLSFLLFFLLYIFILHISL
jgi:hypothetical protein